MIRIVPSCCRRVIDRIEVGDCIDLARLHRFDGPFTATHADERDIIRRKPGLGHQIEHKEVAGRVRGGHTDLEAFEVGNRLEGPVLADSEHHAGKPAELDDGADVLSHGLCAQCVLVRACRDVDGAREQGIERLPPAFEIAHGDGESVVAEMTSPVSYRHRQIIEMRPVGDAKLERGAFKLLRMG